MKSKTQKTSVQGKLIPSIGLLFLAAAGSVLTSCAYTETMNQREAEGQFLQQELQKELVKGRKLTQ